MNPVPLWSRIMGWYYGVPHKVMAPPKVIHVETPPISCFALGLIKLIKEKPDEWSFCPGCGHGDRYTCTNPNVTVSVLPNDWPLPSMVDPAEYLYIGDNLDCGLSNHEKTMITEAMKTYLIAPQRERERLAQIEWQKKANAKRDALKARFEQIGCPKP